MTTLNCVVIYVSDMDRSIAFYRDVLGLSISYQSPKWTEFGIEGITLALHLADAHEHTYKHTKTPAGHCQISLNVLNLDAFHAEMLGKGITCLHPPKDEEFGKLAIYADPDDMPFSVVEAGLV